MIQTSARLLKVLSLLQSQRFWAGGDLASQLGVTERSVRRDVDRLRTLGYPVHATAGVGGGYQLGAGKELPPLPLEDDEAVAVAVGLRAAAVGPITGLEEAAVRALGKLEQVLPKRLRRRVNALQAVSVRLGDAAGPTVDAEALAVLANACRDELQVRFGYGNREGEATERHVEPYRLVHTRFRWYLLAYDLGKEDWRTFRVDRIGANPKAGRGFKPRSLPAEDVAAYVSQRVSTDAHRFRARATVNAPAHEVSAKLSGIAFRVEEGGPGQSIVHTGADNLESVAWLLGSMGLDFEVHEPPELIEHLRRLSERLGRAAGSASRASASEHGNEPVADLLEVGRRSRPDTKG